MSAKCARFIFDALVLMDTDVPQCNAHRKLRFYLYLGYIFKLNVSETAPGTSKEMKNIEVLNLWKLILLYHLRYQSESGSSV